MTAEETQEDGAWTVTLCERDFRSGEAAIVDGGDYMQANGAQFEVKLASLVTKYATEHSDQ
ncbi:MAG: hypothetical protein LLG14_19520 [Nocardiaceae bacterium]|nr:hypothetical protein [Nocardiaceae bacterium]